MKNNKFIKLFICINIILVSIIIIATADATTTNIKKTETITIKTTPTPGNIKFYEFVPPTDSCQIISGSRR